MQCHALQALRALGDQQRFPRRKHRERRHNIKCNFDRGSRRVRPENSPCPPPPLPGPPPLSRCPAAPAPPPAAFMLISLSLRRFHHSIEMVLRTKDIKDKDVMVLSGDSFFYPTFDLKSVLSYYYQIQEKEGGGQ